MEYMGNNRAEVIGFIEDDFAFSHQVYGENFYLFTLRIPRLSGICDFVRVMISERLLVADEPYHSGDAVKITGQFRSYNNTEDTGSKLVLTVFAKDITHGDEREMENPNNLYLNGYICKEPVYRTTPFGREITDMLLAVNRTYNKSDYIPIIAWGRNARFSKTLQVGDNVQIWGRIQSRSYQKRISETETVTKTAYEVSANRIEV